MGDARERLLAVVRQTINLQLDADYDDLGASELVDAFLSRPDDLLAVLVEAGVLEERYMLEEDGPIYRRTEGGDR